MHALGTLAGLDRRLRRASVLGAARALRAGSVDNARRSLAAIGLSRADRAALQESLDSAVAPGHLAALDRAECLALLGSREIGRVAFVARAGVPQIVPVNYQLSDERLLVRTGPGPLVHAAQRREHVAFEVDHLDEHRHAGWSVIVHGTLSELPPAGRSVPGDVTPWASGPRRHLLQLDTRRVTGRRLVGLDRT